QRVDMARTERYAEAVRAARYAETRGEADFAQLSSTVAQALNQIALLPNPKERLEVAEKARRTLAAWPGAHYGYRAAEVREIIGMLDEVISGLQAAAGTGTFELALSTHTDLPPGEPLLPPPDHTEIVQNLMTASTLVESPIERVSLLQSVVALIDRAVDYLPSALASTIRRRALDGIAEEQRIGDAYAALRAATLADAVRYSERADVRALEGLRQRLYEED